MDPKSLLFTESHEWVEGSGDERKVGITDHAQQMLGDIVFVELPQPGTTVSKGDEIVTVESPKAAASVYAPVSGEITAVNEALESAPETINGSPYGDGWLVAIKPSNIDAEAPAMMDKAAYEKKVEED